MITNISTYFVGSILIKINLGLNSILNRYHICILYSFNYKHSNTNQQLIDFLSYIHAIC